MTKLNELALNLLTQGKNFATVSTVMSDGSPQATVVWIDSDGTNVVFNTAEGRVKTDNLRRDPRAAVAVTNAENPYQQVTIRGKVVEMIHEGADEHIDDLAKRYMGVDKYPLRSADEKRVIVKIAPESVSSMG